LSGVVHDCPPFLVSDGHPNRPRTVNAIGLTRHRFDEATIENLKKVYVHLFGQKARRCNNMLGLIDTLDETLRNDEQVVELVAFVQQLAQAPHGRWAEVARKDDKRATPTR